MQFLRVAASLWVVAGLVGCSKSGRSYSHIRVPQVQGPFIDSGSVPPGTGRPVTLSNGAEIYIQNLGGTLFFLAEGTFTPDSFSHLMNPLLLKPEAERRVILSQEIDKIFFKIRSVQGIGLGRVPEVGYFNFEMPYQPELFALLKGLSFSRSLLVNPVPYEPSHLEEIRALSPASEGLVPRFGPRGQTRGFSGLERIHAPEFVKQAEADIADGIKVDGSSVHVGVTDTGITLNHPTFQSADGSHHRIEYLRDFTREGRVYFAKSAKFEISIPEEGSPEDLIVNAEVISTPKLPNLPVGDRFTQVSGLRIKVSPELKIILTRPGSGAKLGVLKEEVFQGSGEKVDLNGDGSLDNQFFLIFVPGKVPSDDVVYFDSSGTADFRTVKPIGDWNLTKTTVSVYSEEFGFDIREDSLIDQNGKEKISVKSASIVGFDPGNHGSHVSGIIAGLRTISNDESSTLARGVAPEASLLVSRVCANNGGCIATEAFVDLAVRAKADVINMSLGGLSVFNDGYGVQETLINRLTSLYNVLFVISAGNSGPGRQTVGSPSTARLALSVGATATREMIQRQYQWPGGGLIGATGNAIEDGDFMLFFSSRGPTAAGGFKPNISAPGTELSSIQLNSAAGSRGGLDVYWGTSMAAPTATGSYALFLDGIRKYNLRNPDHPLPSSVRILREVLIQTATPFDVSRFDPISGEILQGQYTWIDEGTGIVNLVAAWKKLFEVRDHPIPSAINSKIGDAELDYQPLISMRAANGIDYDGRMLSFSEDATFGTGIYLDYFETDTTRQVGITRRLPELLLNSPEAGRLRAQLKTTRDEFVLKVLIYGSNRAWLKAGTLDQLNCLDSETANLSVLGEGALVEKNADGTTQLNLLGASGLNVCIDREMIAQALKPGDHGALIFGYRIVNGITAVLPSFTVPVYLTVPHHTLALSTAYKVQQEVSSFGVKRNYVNIPKGTTLVRVSLEVPSLKKDDEGRMLAGQTCSGVELMALTGTNVSKGIPAREDARIFNCDSRGKVASDEKRKLSFTVINPLPGIWDLPVFGSYKYIQSMFDLRIDYLNAITSLKEILGGIAALTGNVHLNIKDSSFDLLPSPLKSEYKIEGLELETPFKVKQGSQVFVSGIDGSIFRSYADSVKTVTLVTYDSPENDIDLAVFDCPKEVKDPSDAACVLLGVSNGPTDIEAFSFEPRPNRSYLARVEGITVKNEGNFVLGEIQYLEPEKGTLAVSGQNGEFDVAYTMTPAQLSSSKIVGHELFKSGKYKIIGDLTIKSFEDAILSVIPLIIKNENVLSPNEHL